MVEIRKPQGRDVEQPSHISPLVPCPECEGTGWDVDARANFVCDVCEGRGYVVMDVCRGCGRPAFEQGGYVKYCGREECWKTLTLAIDPKKVNQDTPHLRALKENYTRSKAICLLGPPRNPTTIHGVEDAHEAAMRKWREDSSEAEGWMGMC